MNREKGMMGERTVFKSYWLGKDKLMKNQDTPLS